MELGWQLHALFCLIKCDKSVASLLQICYPLHTDKKPHNKEHHINCLHSEQPVKSPIAKRQIEDELCSVGKTNSDWLQYVGYLSASATN